MPELVQLNVPFIFVLLIAVAAAVTGTVLYRRTTPEINKRARYILGFLRAAAVFILILLFFAPQLSLTYIKSKLPRTAVLVDNSASMAIRENDGNRWQQARSVINRMKLIMPEDMETDWFAFNTNVERSAVDTVEPGERGTDFNAVLRFLSNEGYRQACIISDGNQTIAGYPLRKSHTLDMPVYTVGIGNRGGKSDLYIADVQFDAVTYQNQVQQIEVQIGSSKLSKQQNTMLHLKKDGKTLFSKAVLLQPGSGEQSVTFDHKHETTGLHRLSVSIDAVDEESNTRNNSRTIVQEVLKNRLRIGVFAGQLDYDSKFIRFLLRRYENVEVYRFVEKPSGQFYGSADEAMIDSLDVLVLVNHPGRFTRSATITRLNHMLQTRQPGVMVVNPNITGLQRLERMDTVLPVNLRQPAQNDLELQSYRTNPATVHPVVNLFDSRELQEQFWEQLPPVITNKPNADLKPDARTLVSAENGSVPLIVSYEERNHKSIWFNGRAFWRWHFLMQNQMTLNEGYGRLLQNAARWLGNKTQLKPVILHSENNVYRLGNTITINGHLYDSDFSAIPDGQIQLQVRNREQSFQVEMRGDSAGHYKAEFIPPSAGKLVINGKGLYNGQTIGSDRLELQVVPYERELLQTAQNQTFLRSLAGQYGGFYVSPAGLDSLQPALNLQPERIREKATIEIWNTPILLILFLAIIIAEWIIRKRYGLA